MKPIKGLDWRYKHSIDYPIIDELFYSVFGVIIRIGSNDRNALGRIQSWLPTSWVTTKPQPSNLSYTLTVCPTKENIRQQVYHIHAGSEYIGSEADLDEACLCLNDSLHFSVAVKCRRMLFVHAGVVAWRGQALVFPGRSGIGKTTLVEALVRKGAHYFSDEFAAFDQNGHVYPYDRPLCVRNDSEHRHQLKVEEFGGLAGSSPLPVGQIVSMFYSPGERFHLSPVSSGTGFFALFENTIVIRIASEFAMPILRRVASSATAWRGIHNDARAVARTLLDRLNN